MLASLANSKAFVALTLGAFIQVVPSVVYCQVPLVVSKPVIAMPCLAPVSASTIFVPPRFAIIVLISVPVLALSPWLMAVRVGVPLLSNTGEWLTLTRTLTVMGVLTPLLSLAV